jgi:two-component system, NarL family, response regulator NreC
MNTRIVLADDHKIVRQGLRSLLESYKNFEVVAEAENGMTAVRLTKELLPDLVIMDVTMPDINGIEATKQIKTVCPHVKVISLSMHSDKRFVMEMLDAGASGYLLKDCALDELATAINAIMSDQVYVSPSLANVVIKDYSERLDVVTNNPQSLSQKEQMVLRLIAEGQNTKHIASQMGVSIKTVETHRQHVMEKLGLHSIAELTKYAIRTGLTTLDE